jgi:tetratricopeptide (TPR) repeat protein
MQPAAVRSRPRIQRVWLVAVALAVLTAVVFLPALDCEFVNLDDPDYVLNNPKVKAGLTAEGVRWAFTTFEIGNWHPLTWLSLELDGTLWKNPDGKTFNPWGFHLTSLLLHAGSTALLFLALRALTGAAWRSAAVAALFAVHPLHVESVAWVAERKDVLSTFFGMAALLAYAVYVRRPSVARYLVILVAFALSLLAKQMLVTLPCLLLVLDWWPLRRATAGSANSLPAGKNVTTSPDGGTATRGLTRTWLWLLVEKLPIFALTGLAAAATFLAQSGAGAVIDLETFPLPSRIANAVLSYVSYLGKTFWPANLGVFYPHRCYAWGGGLPPVAVAAAALLLVGITAGAVVLRKRAPYLLAGWLWYLGTLVPVIGVLQVGDQAYADRYSYFPQIGILIATCWAVADLARGVPRVAVAVAVVAILVLSIVTRDQLATWQNSIALWENDRQAAGESPLCLADLGVALEEKGRRGEAERSLRRSLELEPKAPITRINLANLLFRMGRLEESAEQFRIACDLVPQAANPRTQLSEVYLRQGKKPQAFETNEEALRLDPNLSAAHCNKGLILIALDRVDEAVPEFREALRLRPDFAEARGGLGIALVRLKQGEEGLAELQEAVSCNPKYAEAHFYLAMELEKQKKFDDAVRHYGKAVENAPNWPPAWFGLGHALSEQAKDHRREDLLVEAIKALQRAVELEPASNLYRQTLEQLRQSLPPPIPRRRGQLIQG